MSSSFWGTMLVFKYACINVRIDKGLVWVLCFNGISTFVGYLMPKPVFKKNSSDTI